MVEGKDEIKDLFSEKLNGFEANVRPELWANISSQIAATSSVVVGGGLSVFSKVIIGVTVAASVIGTSIILLNSPEKENQQKVSEVENTETPQKEEIKDKEIIEDKKNILENEIPEELPTEYRVVTPFIVPEKELPKKQTSNDKGETSTPLLNDKISIEDQKEHRKTDPVLETKEEEFVEIAPIIVPEKNEEEIHIENNRTEDFAIELKNIFTPNGDGVNDYFFLETKGLSDFSIVVMNQKNVIIYKSIEPDFRWDGIGMNGEMVLVGNYVYYVTARDSNGNLIMKHSILRIER